MTATADSVIVQKKTRSRNNSYVNNLAIKNAAMVIRSINHKLRQQIIDLLNENKRMIVTDIYEKLGVEQSTASQHLALLRRANVVTTQRASRMIYYSLNHDRINEIAVSVNNLVMGPESAE